MRLGRLSCLSQDALYVHTSEEVHGGDRPQDDGSLAHQSSQLYSGHPIPPADFQLSHVAL